MLKITNPYGPNTTVLLPGDCNAHCGFCFWDRDSANIPFDHTFARNAMAQLARLVEIGFLTTLSVSGGEPLLSPEFTRFCMALVANRESLRIRRTVLTTHGHYLAKFLDVVLGTFDHINISRHAIGHAENVKVFKTENIPTDLQLKQVIAKIHKQSEVDVTLNCVVPANVTQKFCDDYIKYARSLGADAVSFRKIASDVTPTKAELAFRKRDSYTLVEATTCSVCRGLVLGAEDGFQVRWKGSVEEPSVETQGVYEAVLHPDARLYTDWSRKVPFPFDGRSKPAKKQKSSVAAKRVIPVVSISRGGCGHGGSGGCGFSGI